MTEYLTGILLLVGGLFSLVAALGVLRFRDAFNRLHAATKASTLGIGSALLAAALHFGDGATLFKVILSIFFLFLTIPIGAQLLARSQYDPGRSASQEAPDSEDS